MACGASALCDNLDFQGVVVDLGDYSFVGDGFFAHGVIFCLQSYFFFNFAEIMNLDYVDQEKI